MKKLLLLAITAALSLTVQAKPPDKSEHSIIFVIEKAPQYQVADLVAIGPTIPAVEVKLDAPIVSPATELAIAPLMNEKQPVKRRWRSNTDADETFKDVGTAGTHNQYLRDHIPV